jgi:two-component system phosphate regulon sensor histidine kinase PhoR
MIRKKIIILTVGLLLILYLILGTYISSSLLVLKADKFKENCIWQARCVQIALTDTLPGKDNSGAIKALENQLAEQFQVKVEILTKATADMDEETRKAFDGQEGSTVVSGSEGREMQVVMPLPQKMVLRTSTPMLKLEAEENQIRFSIIAVSLLLLVGGLVLLRKLIAKQTEPLENISTGIQEYLAGKESTRLPLNKNGEFGVISFGFNTVADNYADKCREVQREQYKNKIVLDNIDNAMALINEDGIIIECNKHFNQWFAAGYSALGKSYKEVLPNTKVDEFFTQCLKDKKAQDIAFHIEQNNKKRVFKVFGAPMQEAFQTEPTLVLTVFHDITALQDVYDKQTAFVSNASHELATPLTTIRGFADTLLEEDTGNNPELRQKFLRIILDEAKRMQGLIKDLLQLAKLDQEDYRQSITLSSFAIEPVLREIEREYAVAAANRNLHLVVNYQKLAEPLEIYASRDWFKQILVNLVENALKYTPAEGTISIDYAPEGQKVEFVVHNTGEGFSPEDSMKIFERFYRLDKARSRSQGGSGLGLSIVKFIIEILGGTIRAESKPGEGVSFIFTLPLGKQ